MDYSTFRRAHNINKGITFFTIRTFSRPQKGVSSTIVLFRTTKDRHVSVYPKSTYFFFFFLSSTTFDQPTRHPKSCKINMSLPFKRPYIYLSTISISPRSTYDIRIFFFLCYTQISQEYQGRSFRKVRRVSTSSCLKVE